MPEGSAREIPRLDPSSADLWREALGLKRLRLAWAKAEILLGLSAAAVGMRWLASSPAEVWLGGASFVLGGYLAMAGHRSHLYLAMNRQNAHLARMIADVSSPDRGPR
jgi:hypothetical protein